jgi:predicted DNA-binding transcriptional regulator AlpA
MTEEIGFFTKRQVKDICGISLTQIDRLESQGRFPKRCVLSGNARNSKVGWCRDEIRSWVASRKALRDALLRKE